MTPDLAAAAKPHLSLWTLSEIPSASTTDPIVAKAIQLASQSSAAIVPPDLQQMRRQTVTIHSTAKTSLGAEYAREAVLRVGPGLTKGYQILVWDRLIPGREN
jgi:hypothetical protein